MSPKNRIAVLLTSHNRNDITKKCLNRLYSLCNDIDVYCVDDNSTDGTQQMIKHDFPQVILIKGNGNLFWCRGMRLAWEYASQQKDYDYYFWLNDDMELYPNAFDELLECCTIFSNKAIVTGLVEEKHTRKVIYGGSDIHKNMIAANGELNDVTYMNGNFVVIPKEVFHTIGLFDKIYHHDLGDVDYGLTAKERGFKVCTSRKYIGCTEDALRTKKMRIRLDGTNMIKRLQRLYSPLGSHPFITFHFKKKHQSMLSACFYFLYVHFINLLPDRIWRKLEKIRYKK